ncbi:MAG: cation-transporting P-type ATPase, partial [Actinobacteria bacterium]|nr:cation-transporting P-type ATPase [Actinomycetota bacterium]
VVAGGQTYEVTGLGYGDDGELRLLDGAARTDAPGVAADEDPVQRSLVAAVMCNDAHVNVDEAGAPQLVGDPTEGALVVAARKVGLDPEAIRAAAPRLDEIPFDSASKFMATVHPSHDGNLLVVKGAPDVVLDRCGTLRGPDGPDLLNEGSRLGLLDANRSLGDEGLRVLAVATKVLAPGRVDPRGEVDQLTMEAIIGILDPARPEAVEAIDRCRTAGIDVRMITGDHAATAAAIAAQLGITGEVVTGAQLEAMDDRELSERIGRIGVCARVSPEHKVRVVRALQVNGEVVAMTGDGVNDAPALKQAEIGVAMGITGTEVTKEAGDLILTDDNFATIVAAVERGRAIYENIVTFVRFQLTTNVAAIATILMARLAGYPTPFNPIQILFVNILADGPPAMSLGMDPPRPGVMGHPPRDVDERILSGRRLGPILSSAAIMAVTIMAILARWTDATPATAIEDDPGFTMAFTAFVFLQMVNALIVRSGERSVFHRFSLTNRTFWLAVGGVVLAQVLAVVVPFLQDVFGTTSLTSGQWAVCVLAALPLLVVSEIRTFVVRRRRVATQHRLPMVLSES